MTGRVGYACMNLTLREESPSVRCNRDMQKKTWESEGLRKASRLALQNTRDLVKILTWNISQDIYFYRCTSDFFPWNSEYELQELPNWTKIQENLQLAGDIIKQHDIRFSFHPSYWCKMASKSEETLLRAVEDLNNHGKWLDSMGLPQTNEYPINIHIGGVYGDKEETAQRFRNNLDLLDGGARRRLTVENDDSVNGWSVDDLVSSVGDLVPVTFDYHHHQFSSEVPRREAFENTLPTWDCTPVTHYSEPRCLWGSDSKPQAHSDHISEIPTWLLDRSDVMVEAKKKDKAIL